MAAPVKHEAVTAKQTHVHEIQKGGHATKLASTPNERGESALPTTCLACNGGANHRRRTGHPSEHGAFISCRQVQFGDFLGLATGQP
jgi:hypothetical protein